MLFRSRCTGRGGRPCARPATSTCVDVCARLVVSETLSVNYAVPLTSATSTLTEHESGEMEVNLREREVSESADDGPGHVLSAYVIAVFWQGGVSCSFPPRSFLPSCPRLRPCNSVSYLLLLSCTLYRSVVEQCPAMHAFERYRSRWRRPNA